MQTGITSSNNGAITLEIALYLELIFIAVFFGSISLIREIRSTLRAIDQSRISYDGVHPWK